MPIWCLCANGGLNAILVLKDGLVPVLDSSQIKIILGRCFCPPVNNVVTALVVCGSLNRFVSAVVLTFLYNE